MQRDKNGSGNNVVFYAILPHPLSFPISAQKSKYKSHKHTDQNILFKTQCHNRLPYHCPTRRAQIIIKPKQSSELIICRLMCFIVSYNWQKEGRYFEDKKSQVSP